MLGEWKRKLFVTGKMKEKWPVRPNFGPRAIIFSRFLLKWLCSEVTNPSNSFGRREPCSWLRLRSDSRPFGSCFLNHARENSNALESRVHRTIISYTCCCGEAWIVNNRSLVSIAVICKSDGDFKLRRVWWHKSISFLLSFWAKEFIVI